MNILCQKNAFKVSIQNPPRVIPTNDLAKPAEILPLSTQNVFNSPVIEPQYCVEEPMADEVLYNYKEFYAVEFEVNKHQNLFNLWTYKNTM